MNINELRAAVERTKAAMQAAAAGTDVDAINKSVAEHKLAVAQLAAASADQVQAPVVHARDVKKAPSENFLVQKALIGAVSKYEGIPASVAAERIFGADAVITKAENPVLGARNQAGFSQELLVDQVAAFQQLLQPNSVFGGLMAGALSLNMQNGSVTIPFRESTVKTVTKNSGRAEKQKIGMNSYKVATKTATGTLLGSILAVSNELLAAQQYASTAALIQIALREDLTNTIDEMLLADAAITNAPAGILMGVTPTKIGTTGTDILSGLAEAIGTLQAKPFNFALSDLSIAINPKTRLKLEIMRGTTEDASAYFPSLQDGGNSILGVNLIVSGNVAEGDLVLVHRPSMYNGMGSVAIDTSEQAVVFDAADAPISLWAQNLTGYRLRAGISFGSWRDGAVHLLQIAAKA